MSNTIHEHPGVYSRYDASSVVSAARSRKSIGVAAVATLGTADEVVTVYSCAEGIAVFGEDAEGTVGMGALLRALYENGAGEVKAVKVSEATQAGYEAAFALLEREEKPGVIVCDSVDEEVQQALRESVETASANRRERIAVVGGEADETAADTIARAGGLNSERVVLVSRGGCTAAAAVAAVIAAGTDPSLPISGAVLYGVDTGENYSENEIDALVRGGVTPLETVGGEASVVRGITSRTMTGEAEDATWRELTTILIVDDVIPGIRDALHAKFLRGKNTERSRAAIRSQLIVELENKLSAEYIDSYGDVSVKAMEDDPTVCLVEFSFAVAHGLSRIYLSAHITV